MPLDRVPKRDRSGDAAVVGISAALVYDIFSSTNSSPQTTEINARRRAATLMKWVHAGAAQAIGFILVMTMAEPPGKKWRPILGGGLGLVLMYGQYVYAKDAGLRSVEEGTEDTTPVASGPHAPNMNNPRGVTR